MFSNAANNSGSLPISEAELKRVLASAQGRQLLAAVRRSGDDALRQAMDAAKVGDYEAAKAAIAPVLQNPEVAALLRELNHG